MGLSKQEDRGVVALLSLHSERPHFPDLPLRRIGHQIGVIPI